MKVLIAEGLGTAILVIMGCGTACALGCNPALSAGYISTALAFGLTVMAMAYSIGQISGCHINPAVSFAMFSAGRISVMEFLKYTFAQCIGAIAGSAFLSQIFPIGTGLGTNFLLHNNLYSTICIEAFMTFVFTFVILFVTEKWEYQNIAGLVIGLTLVLIHLFGIDLTGTSVNPARSLGPAVFVRGKALDIVWAFWVGPLLGALVAGQFFRFMKDAIDE
jgi:aquaporin Z